MTEIAAIALGMISVLGFGVLGTMLHFHHRQQALRFWERERRLPDATRFENLKLLAEQEEHRLQEIRDQLFDARNTIDEAERLKKWMEDSRLDREQLEVDRQEISRVQADLARLQGQLAEQVEQRSQLEGKLEEVRRAIEVASEMEGKLKQNLSALNECVQQSKQELQLLEAKIVSTRKELEGLEQSRNTLNAEVESLRRKFSDLEEEYKKRAEKLHGQAEEHRQRLQKELEGLKSQRDELSSKVAKLNEEFLQAKQELKRVESERNELQSECTKLRASVQEARSQSEILQKSLDALSSAVVGRGGGGSAEQSASDLWVEVLPSGTTKNGPNDENKALDKFRRDLSSRGLKFHERTINAFHTSLKTTLSSPLVVLAGVSGTGKSELPRRYAESMGMNFLNIAVQPRWDSPQDLFGFYDYLEQRFRPTELTRALIQMDRFRLEKDRGWLKSPEELMNEEMAAKDRCDEMLLVLLDEMNLARIEYYFSEFLSRLETRRGINLHNPDDRKKCEITLDVGGRRGAQPMRLFVNTNVLFVGTMNEDETTQSLSDKVIDRANILRFGSPATIESQTAIPTALEPTSNSRLAHQTWQNSWVKPAQNLDNGVREKMLGWIKELRTAMDSIQRPFAYRVANGMLEYAANYPDVKKNLGWVISDQIEQKILPKLRGVDPTEPRVKRAFETINKILRDQDVQDELLVQHLQKCNTDNYFQWIGLDRSREENGDA